MIRVYVGNNIERAPHDVDINRTLRSVLQECGIDYSQGVTSLDGASIQPGGLDKTFAEYGVTNECFLIVTVNTKNA